MPILENERVASPPDSPWSGPEPELLDSPDDDWFELHDDELFDVMADADYVSAWSSRS
jgi:hypothetical protein